MHFSVIKAHCTKMSLYYHFVLLFFAGASVGYLLTMPVSGLLTKYGFDGGWASVFYCFGRN